MISKSLSTSRKYAALNVEAGVLAEFCQVLFPLIVAHADDFGRLPGDVFTVRHLVFPTSPRSLEEFNAALVALDHVGLIQRYHKRGGDYIQVCRFDDHQVGLTKRTKSKIPTAAGTSGTFQEIPEIPGSSGRFSESPLQLNRTKQNLTEENLTQPNGNTDTRFQRFWLVYPKKKAKDDAKKAFEKRKPDDAMTEQMIRAVQAQAQSEDWLREGGRYIPYPATWLNAGRWTDEETAPARISSAGSTTQAAGERVKALLREGA